MTQLSPHIYALALGSNRRHGRWGAPHQIIRRTLDLLDDGDVELLDASRIMTSRPIGPSRRAYANAVALVVTRLEPDALLHHLKAMEAYAGRRRGQRWSARTLDLDIILWSGGIVAQPDLLVPHPAYPQREFVLRPLAEIAAGWRDPLTGRTVQQSAARLNRAKPVDQPHADD